MRIQITPKNWEKFQHYKDRTPPWIKLHRGILTDYKFSRLPVASKAIAPLLWLLSSESEDGLIDMDINELAFRISVSEKEICAGLLPLLYSEFFTTEDQMLATCLQDACGEKERETEREEFIYGDVPKDIPRKVSPSGLHMEKSLPPAEAAIAESKFGMTAEEAEFLWEKFKAFHLNPENKRNAKEWFYPWRVWLAEDAKRRSERATRFASKFQKPEFDLDDYVNGGTGFKIKLTKEDLEPEWMRGVV